MIAMDITKQERDYTLGIPGRRGAHIGHILVGRCEDARCLGRKREAIGSFFDVLTCGRGGESVGTTDWAICGCICLVAVLFGA